MSFRFCFRPSELKKIIVLMYRIISDSSEMQCGSIRTLLRYLRRCLLQRRRTYMNILFRQVATFRSVLSPNAHRTLLSLRKQQQQNEWYKPFGAFARPLLAASVAAAPAIISLCMGWFGSARSNSGWMTSGGNTWFFCHRFRTRIILLYVKSGLVKVRLCRWFGLPCLRADI